MILNGRDNTLGGNIIIPMEIKTEAITISMIKKGTYIKNPISNARRNSLIIKAGIVILRDAFLISLVGKKLQVFFTSIFDHKFF